VSGPKSVRINKWEDWEQVTPYFRHYKGNTLHRDHRGRHDQYYRNTTGRNDIVGAKVARDNKKLYFYVETADRLTSPNDRNWMMLFIDTDRDKTTGWNGYDILINRVTPLGNRAVVERNVGNRWEWEEVAAVPFSLNNNKLALGVDRQVLGVEGKVDIEFKWNDNMQENGNIMDFYVNGDTAPGGRFNFVYSAP